MGIDIDLTGDNEQLPPGVQPGTLDGTDAPSEPVAESDPEAGQFASEEDVPPADVPWDGEIREGHLGGDDGEPDRTIAEAAAAVDHEGEDVPLPPDDTPESPANDELPLPPEPSDGVKEALEGEDINPPEPEPPAEEPKPKKRAARKKKGEAKAKQSGRIDRLYTIFQETQAEVDGNIVPVYVQRAFVVDGETIQGVVARNRDIALSRAGKLFGENFQGTLVAVSAASWEPKPVSNLPEPRFKVTVG